MANTIVRVTESGTTVVVQEASVLAAMIEQASAGIAASTSEAAASAALAAASAEDAVTAADTVNILAAQVLAAPGGGGVFYSQDGTVRYRFAVVNGSVEPVIDFDLFANSLSGSDLNSGASTATAFATLGKAQTELAANESLGLARGSLWREGFIVPASNIAIDTWGAIGAAPIIDGAGPVLETWTQHDAATYPNTWNISITHGFAVANGRMMIWENGTMLRRVDSIAAVNASAGTYYSPSDNAFTGSPTAIVYAHATGSGNPNSNGKTYERTKLQSLLHGAYAGRLATTVRNVVTGRQGDNDGSIVLGIGSTMERVLAFDGHKHNALQESGVCRESAFINAQPESNYLHVFYTPDAAGLSAAYQFSVFVGQTNGLRGSSAIYCHDNSGAAHSLLAVTGCCFANVAETIASSAVTLTVSGAYIKNCNAAFSSITGSSSDLSHMLVNRQYFRNSFASAGNHTVRQSGFYMRNYVTFMQLSLADWGNITLDHVTIHMGDWDETITTYDRDIVRRTAGTGTFSAHHCVFIFDDTDTTIAPVMRLNSASIGTINNNVYFYRGDFDKNSLKWEVDGVNKTFAEWQALGHDTNSRLYDASDVTFANLFNGHPVNGDFRLKTGLALTLPDGTAVSTLGVQEHYDFNQRAVVAGAPSAWPTMPETYAQGLAYVGNPEGWAF